ncbi:hypothetical protein ACIBG8_18305 [Nonomuraea sp. NPDC050556]|uniref:hypothetical protein n=1 Tax=Nonomuraea sp. NPDC050556 TaxID=3364369 RepID=UPI0037BB2D81
MHPYKSIALGLLIAAIDLRLNGFDLIVDAIGWFIVLQALDQLTRQVHPAFLPARTAALVAGLVSLTDLVGLGLPAPISFLLGLADVAAVWFVATAVMAVASANGDERTDSLFNVLRWATVATTALALAGVFVGGWVLVLFGLAVRIWLIVELARAPEPALTQ